MKQLKFKIVAMLFIASILGMSSNLFAQRGYRNQNVDRPQRFQNQDPGFYCRNIPDLTEEQQDEIMELRTAHLKEMQDERNALAEKRVRLRSLRTSNSPDMGTINQTIEEMSEIRATMQKEREKHIQNIRNVLTDDQRVYFDARKARGPRAGMGRGQGRGNGRGYGGRGLR